jgi:hypothetical protein
MGASLGYWTTRAVNPPLRQQLLAEAEQAIAGHTWWCEPLGFFDWDAGAADREDDPADGPQLAGATKLFVLGDVDPMDDAFMAARDARHIVELLAGWSARHGLTWCVSAEGAPLGRITGGVADVELLAALDALAIGAAGDEARAQALLAAHPDR